MRIERVVLVQGVYFVATGLAPFASRRLFEAFTGPKREWWLVQTVGATVTAVGAGLIMAAVRGDPPPEVLVIGAGTSAGLAAIDVAYVAKRRIAPTYLVDAGIELGLVAALVGASSARRHLDAA
jgi:hypothetical protein